MFLQWARSWSLWGISFVASFLLVVWGMSGNFFCLVVVCFVFFVVLALLVEFTHVLFTHVWLVEFHRGFDAVVVAVVVVIINDVLVVAAAVVVLFFVV